MAQVFFPSANTISRVSLLALPLVVLVVVGSTYEYASSQYATRVGYAIDQPIQFSHEHHVTGLGIDCRYCHTSVEDGPFAGIPPTETCMSCHSQVWTNADMLAPVRQSWATGERLAWERVHKLPDFAYFDHSIHVNRGIGCATCHGEVHEMPLIAKAQTLHMEWCLNCHRQPWPNVQPRETLFDTTWRRTGDERERAAIERAHEQIQHHGLTNCSTCHR